VSLLTQMFGGLARCHLQVTCRRHPETIGCMSCLARLHDEHGFASNSEGSHKCKEWGNFTARWVCDASLDDDLEIFRVYTSLSGFLRSLWKNNLGTDLGLKLHVQQ
jgi:hypothetical protein